eukprot:Plantae.Rhodophyta-Hildenbrandia_rubra.ctg5905.p1 GENE.Plantae.Rhodophyta-Hildenbrandia_rubra.ctg5905~~Plantae.Rhodophyta-Hildenbrandia_rubra.ctg5905.p1  ORF type:complete len:522 (-),score=97.17 Plantae.Rhodophyta-Hildenbrandia_rubra.ctg5905:1960-3525(-)
MYSFVHLIPTPSTSAKGWTTGKPPPSSLWGVGDVRLCSNRTSKGFAGVNMLVNADKKREVVKEEDDMRTVDSYVRFGRDDFNGNGANGRKSGVVGRDGNVELIGKRGRAGVRGTIDDAGSMTQAVHGGEKVRGKKTEQAMLDAIATPIVQSSTFTFRNTRECIEYNQGKYQSFEYGRYGNPTTRVVEEKLMALENAEDALLSASGMNAVTTMLLALVPRDGHIVTTTDCYRRTRQFIKTVLPSMGIRTSVIDAADTNAFRDILSSDRVDLFFSESPTNPMIRVIDSPTITSLCKRYGVISVIDTTFATAVNFRPVDFGADLVLHSGTKYLAGHNDVLCGALAGKADLIDRVRKLHGVLGGVIDPHAAYLVLRGLKTLGLRMEAHNRNALNLARYLEAHPKVSKVHYPALSSHDDCLVAKSQFSKGYGGVLSFEMKGDGDMWSRATFETAGRFIDALHIPYIGPSMGGCESLVEQVCIMGYFDQPLCERKRLGINNGLVRFSCGIEDTNDLVNDVEQALDAA